MYFFFTSFVLYTINFDAMIFSDSINLKLVSIAFFWQLSILSFAQFPIVLQAEKAELHGDLKIKYNTGLSNGAYIGDHHIRTNSYLRFLGVNVEKAGTYEFKIAYLGGSGRTLYIKVNNYVRTFVVPTVSTPWDNPPTGLITTYIFLDAGNNTITIGPHNDDGPNLDKFEINKTDHLIAQPELEKILYAYDLTDDAISITGQDENETFKCLTDNDVSTIYTVPGKTSTSIVASFDQPVVVSGYILAGLKPGISAKMDYSRDKNVWYALTPKATTDLGGGTAYSMNRKTATAKSDAAKYYRLTFTGTADLALAEWQLFGIPYLNNTDGKSFPADATQGVDWTKKGFAEPEGNVTANESFRSLFNRSLANKYYTNQQRGFYVTYELDSAYTISNYTLTSCEDYPSRDPKNWIMNAYNKDDGWLEIDIQQEFKFPFPLTCMKFIVNSDKKFTQLLLDVTDNQVHATEVQLLKWQTFGTTATSTNNHSSVVAENIKIFAESGTIVVENNNSIESDYELFNCFGGLVAKGQIEQGTAYISAPQGLNLLRLTSMGSSQTAKIQVK